MCGICGWTQQNENLSSCETIIKKMTETLARRGPDQTNHFVSTHCLLGHKRLAVVDLEGGKQPMTIGNFTICYNGELYNTEDIRKELLQLGHTFQSYSDTEVLLIAYIQWKEHCLEKLNGIFAFAVYEHDTNRIFVARDRLGVKPLFYKETTNGVIFASEIKAILEHPAVNANITEEGLYELFCLSPSRTPGKTVFKDIFELRAGHYFILDKGIFTIRPYWQLQSKQHEHSLEETIYTVKQLVTDAVERQLVSDVPLCTFLSGGIDSSIISALAAKKYGLSGEKLTTFSIDYEDNKKFFQSSTYVPAQDEYYIKKMVDEFATNHHFYTITQEKLIEFLEEATTVRDLPGMADIDSSLLWFCKAIKNDFTVGLSGECADEIFGGYPWFFQNPELKQTFPWLRSLDERKKLLHPKWQQQLKIEDYLQSQVQFGLSEVPLLDGESEMDSYYRKLFFLNIHWFMPTLLERKDRMSMGASLEVRVPFADHRIVEYLWNVPWEMKYYQQREKGLLREAFSDLIPHEVLYRKKSPYPKTHSPIYSDMIGKQLQQCINDKSSLLLELFNKPALQQLIDSKGASFTIPWFGQLMSGPQLLAYLVQIHYWGKQNNINIIG